MPTESTSTPTAPKDETFWVPTAKHIASSHLSSFVIYLNQVHRAAIPIGDQNALHLWTLRNPRSFWHAVATHLSFSLSPSPTPTSALVRTAIPRLPHLVNVAWFPGATTNVASVLLRHATLSPNAPAIISCPESRSAHPSYRTSLSHSVLHRRVARLAAALRAAGVRKGDSVAAVLPNSPDTVTLLLAVATVGAVWSCCSPDFGPSAVVSRLSQTAPVVLFYTPAYVYKGKLHDISDNIESCISELPSVRCLVAVDVHACVIRSNPLRRPHVPCRHVSLTEFVDTIPHDVPFEPEPMTLSDPLVTMFSSGTTGKPKCIVQGAGIVLNQMKEHSLHLEMTSSSKVFFNTNTGWMMFNWLVAVLACGASIVLYDGAAALPDDPLRLLHIAADESVTHFGCGAKLLHFWQQAMLRDRSLRAPSTPSLQMVLGTGSPSTALHFRFVANLFGYGVQYVSISGGTDINGCFALGTPWKSVISPQLQCAGLGMDVGVLNDDGRAIVGKSGELVCRNAVPCMPLNFAHDPDHTKYRAAYFERFGDTVWCHGDFAEETVFGGFIISGRSDSTLNPGGVRIGTADIYQVVETVPFISTTLIAERLDANGDGTVFMLLVLRAGEQLDEKRTRMLRSLIRTKLSPRHVPQVMLQVLDIPFTFSGKKCEMAFKKALNGREIDNVEAVQNPKALELMKDALHRYTNKGRKQRKTIRSKL